MISENFSPRKFPNLCVCIYDTDNIDDEILLQEQNIITAFPTGLWRTSSLYDPTPLVVLVKATNAGPGQNHAEPSGTARAT